MIDESFRWLDTHTYREVVSSVVGLEMIPYTTTDGAGEATLETIVATWPVASPGLLLRDAPCKWTLISSGGPGDLRGYAMPPTGLPFPVVAEIKFNHRPVTLSVFTHAVQQSVEGLRSLRAIYDGGEHQWLLPKPEFSKAAVVVVANAWNVDRNSVESEFMNAASSIDFLEPGARIQAHMIAIERYVSATQRLIKVTTQCAMSDLATRD